MNYQKGIGVVVIVTIVAIVFIVGGVVYVSTGEKQSTETSTPVSKTDTFSDDNSSLGSNEKCTMSFGNEGAPIRGTIYISGESVRQHLIDSTTEHHVIIKDSTAYAWEEGSEVGAKIISDDPKFMENSLEMLSMRANPDPELAQIYNFSCEEWYNTDPYRFNLPNNVDFIEIDESY